MDKGGCPCLIVWWTMLLALDWKHQHVLGQFVSPMYATGPSKKHKVLVIKCQFKIKELLLVCPGIFYSKIKKTTKDFGTDHGKGETLGDGRESWEHTLVLGLFSRYTAVGDIEFFYYFIKSEGNPTSDPLMVFVNGGPGCSALNGVLFEIGPLKVKTENYTGGVPTLLYEKNTWTKFTNIIFLDTPVGTGFTYATTPSAWITNDALAATHMHTFTRTWLRDHPQFLGNPFYLGSDSFSGLITPQVAQLILNGNENGLLPFINIKGLSLSCAHTNSGLEKNTRVQLAHHFALISDELYLTAKTACNGVYHDPKTPNCTEAVMSINKCIEMINLISLLDPKCATVSPEPEKGSTNSLGRVLGEKSDDKLALPSVKGEDYWCRNYIYLLATVWINFDSVQEALGVRNGTVERWVRCNLTINGYTINIHDVVPVHKNLTETGLQLLVFNGDHDMTVPNLAVQSWIKSLGLTVDLPWRPWFVDGQVAGYTVKYTNDGYRLTYATVKGAGHSPEEYKRRECFNMFHRWINYYPL